jgi:hypothetical protein
MPPKEKREKQRITFYVDPRHRFIHLLKGNSMILNCLLDKFFGDGDTEKAQTDKLLRARELIVDLKREQKAADRERKVNAGSVSKSSQQKQPKKGSPDNGDGRAREAQPEVALAVSPEPARPFAESAKQHEQLPGRRQSFFSEDD